MDKRIVYSAILALYVLLMIVLALTPSFGFLNPLVSANDKTLHFAEFFVLTIIVLLTVRTWGFERKYIVTVVACVLVLVASEQVQRLISTRSFDYLDMLADFTGILLAVLVDKVANMVRKWQSSSR